MNTFTTIVSICSGIMTIVGLVTLFVSPIREKLFKTKEQNAKRDEGIKCLLRSEILHCYYRHEADRTIRQHTRENIDKLYASYKALDGNSFIDDIYQEIKEFKVIS